MPLDDAVVYNDKVYGTMGPYVLRFNGDTGALEDSGRVTDYYFRGPCHITQMSGSLWVSLSDSPATLKGAWLVPHYTYTRIGGGLVAVNPTTLALGAIIDLPSLHASAPYWYGAIGERVGPLTAVAPYIYYWKIWQGTSYGGGAMYRVNPTTSAGAINYISGDAYDDGAVNEAITTDGTWVYFGVDGYAQRTEIATINDANPATATEEYYSMGGPDIFMQPRGVAVISGDSSYSVLATPTLYRGTYDPAGGATANYNLATVQAGVQPCRIRYRASTNRLYIPCPGQNGVILWNPDLNTGTWIGGLDYPIDVVFTSTKVWAVQNSITPLVDIT